MGILEENGIQLSEGHPNAILLRIGMKIRDFRKVLKHPKSKSHCYILSLKCAV